MHIFRSIFCLFKFQRSQSFIARKMNLTVSFIEILTIKQNEGKRRNQKKYEAAKKTKKKQKEKKDRFFKEKL